MPIPMHHALALAATGAAMAFVGAGRRRLPNIAQALGRAATITSVSAVGRAATITSVSALEQERRRLDNLRRQIPGAGRPIELIAVGIYGKNKQFVEDPNHRERLRAAGWTDEAIAYVEAHYDDVEQCGLFYGPPEAAVGFKEDGSRYQIPTWAQVDTIAKQVEAFREKADKASSSSSWSSLAEYGGGTSAKNSPSWKKGSLTGFYHWMWRKKGPEGGVKHIAAVAKALKETGGNLSFWGKVVRNIGDITAVIGAVLQIVPGLGSAIGAGIAVAGQVADRALEGDASGAANVLTSSGLVGDETGERINAAAEGLDRLQKALKG